MIAVIQYRQDQSFEHEQKCFNKWLPLAKLDFISIFDDSKDWDEPQKLLQPYEKIMFAGSGEFLITRNDDKTALIRKRMSPLINYVVEQDFPTLGICFGSQLLGSELGSRIENDPAQAEAGVQQVQLTPSGKADPLFRDMSNPLSMAMGHEDSLLTLPGNAVHLAYSDKCENQAYRLGNNVYGAQFHVELDDNDLYERLQLYAQYDNYNLGYDVPERMHGPQVLLNFVTLKPSQPANMNQAER